MNIADIISKSAVLDNVQAASKRELVQSLSERIAALSGLDERAVFDAVWERENLGSTGYGEGVAFPHARIEGLEKVCGMRDWRNRLILILWTASRLIWFLCSSVRKTAELIT